jgi:Uncharacterised protein family (UPF0203)
MGSSQSTSTVESPANKKAPLDQVLTTTTAENTNESNISKTDNIRPKKQERAGMDAVNFKCRKKKAAYDRCVSEWYNERFLTGKSISQEEECGNLFESYRQCYLKGIKREFFDKGKKQPKEGSILAEELNDRVKRAD